MHHLTRTRSVLILRDTGHHEPDITGTLVKYGRSHDDELDGPFRMVLVDEATRMDLGDPEHVTVTIEPGDLLNTPVEELETTFEIVDRADGKVDWRLVHRNGDVLCGSDQGYENEGDCVRTAERVLGIQGGYGIKVAATEDSDSFELRSPQAR